MVIIYQSNKNLGVHTFYIAYSELCQTFIDTHDILFDSERKECQNTSFCSSVVKVNTPQINLFRERIKLNLYCNHPLFHRAMGIMTI